MMVGGGLMLFFGLLFMLIIIGLPILLIVASVAGLWGPLGRRSGTTASSQGADRQIAPAAASTRYCSHCAQGLQTDWTYCPHCGAPV